MLYRNVSRYLLAPSCTLLLLGCMVGPDFCLPEPPDTDSYIEDVPVPEKTASTVGVAGISQRLNLCQELPKCWWELFHSQELNDLIQIGLQNSPTVDAAQAALRQSEENLWAFIASTMFPSVTGQIMAQRQRFSPATLGIEPAGGPGTGGTATNNAGNEASFSPTFSLYNVSVNIAYTVDLFGANRRQIEGLQAQVDNSCYLLQGTYLTLTANIVTTAITEASYRGQIRATKELIALAEEHLKILQRQFTLGGVSRAEILQQEAQLAQFKANLPVLKKNLAVTRHSLSALVGELPSEYKLPNFYFGKLKLPREIPLGIPSQLVCQRPDIKASEALLHAASAQIGVATANLLPQLTINGNFGTEANFVKDLFQANSAIWSATANLAQPLFNAGSLRAKRRAAIAAYDQACAVYQQTVLQAFQNVADSLRAIEFDAIALKDQMEAEIAARDSYVLVKEQFQLGAVNAISMLISETQYQQAKINRIQAEAQRFADVAALFQALGGGWWNCEPACP